VTLFVKAATGKKQHIVKEEGKTTYCMVAPNVHFRQPQSLFSWEKATVTEEFDPKTPLCKTCERLGPLPMEVQRALYGWG